MGGNYFATYGYNTAGQLTSASDPFSSYAYTYDGLGDLASVNNAGTPGVPNVTLNYTYDSFGNRTNLSDSRGGSVNYAYNGDNQLTGMGLSVSGTQDAQLTFAYDAGNRLTGMTRAASAAGSHTITTSYGYDKANELTNITHTDATANATLASYTYGYDTAGNLTSYQDNNSSLTYGYDKASQLTSASGTLNGSPYSVSYSYDANGNRTMTGYQTGTGNELLSDGVYNYTYDNAGNTLTQTNIATGNVTYFTWDYRNRLTEVQVKDSHGNLLNDEKFTYDVSNNRIGVSLNGVQQLYTVYDGSNPYMDFNGSGTLTERYLTNPNGLNQFYGQVSASGIVQWLLTDNINSIRQAISAGGTSLDAITYDPYGNILNQTNSANAPRFLFTGATVNSLTGGYLTWARPYNPSDGRFESEDWLGFAAGDANLDRYVFNSPTSFSDPTGFILSTSPNRPRTVPVLSTPTGSTSYHVVYVTGIGGGILSPTPPSWGGLWYSINIPANMLRGLKYAYPDLVPNAKKWIPYTVVDLVQKTSDGWYPVNENPEPPATTLERPVPLVPSASVPIKYPTSFENTPGVNLNVPPRCGFSVKSPPNENLSGPPAMARGTEYMYVPMSGPANMASFPTHITLLGNRDHTINFAIWFWSAPPGTPSTVQSGSAFRQQPPAGAAGISIRLGNASDEK